MGASAGCVVWLVLAILCKLLQALLFADIQAIRAFGWQGASEIVFITIVNLACYPPTYVLIQCLVVESSIWMCLLELLNYSNVHALIIKLDLLGYVLVELALEWSHISAGLLTPAVVEVVVHLLGLHVDGFTDVLPEVLRALVPVALVQLVCCLWCQVCEVTSLHY